MKSAALAAYLQARDVMKRPVATTIFVALPLAVSVWSCSGAISPSSDSAEPACAAYRAASDALAARCRDGLHEAKPPTFDAYCARLVAAPGSGLSAPLMQNCADKLATLACDETTNDECGLRSARGKLPDGSSCGADSQCASGECRSSVGPMHGFASEASDDRCGKCAPPGAPAPSCTGPSYTCPVDAFCEYNVSGSKCVRFAAEGESCAAGLCAPLLLCDPASERCVRAPRAGAPCRNFCAGSLRCINDTCQLGVLAGGACPTGWECARGLACRGGTCEDLPLTPLPLGASCGKGGACGRDAHCSRTNVCVPRIAPGAACDVYDTPCTAYHTCLYGVCTLIDPGACK